MVKTIKQIATELSSTAISNTKTTNSNKIITQITGTKLKEETFNKAIHFLKVDKNLEINEQKVKLLWHNLKNEFTEETFIEIVKRIMRTKTYNNLTTSDFFEVSNTLPKFKSYLWYLKQLQLNQNANDFIECYLDLKTNTQLFKEKDGTIIQNDNLKRLF